MKRKYFIGIDPGQTGAVAVIREDLQKAWVYDYPKDISEAAKLIRAITSRIRISFAVIEKVGAMPKQGVTSVFSFGTNYGSWQGIIASHEIPYSLVTPQAWQKKMLGGSKKGTPKERSLQIARRIFPKVALTGPKGGAKDGRADALHLARYARFEVMGD